MFTAVDQRDHEIERLKSVIKQLQRAQFGRRSERLDTDQLAFSLDDLDADIGCIEVNHPIVIAETNAAPTEAKTASRSSATRRRFAPLAK
jgi:hypothetical protein